MFLTPAELVALTGYKRAWDQRRWLADRAWPFEVDARGRPVVLKSVLEARLGEGTRPRAGRGPNWAALHGAT